MPPCVSEKNEFSILDLILPECEATEGMTTEGESFEPLTPEEQAAATQALAKLTETAFKVSSLFGERPNALVVSLAASDAPETTELLETLKAWKEENPYDNLKQVDLGYHYLTIEEDYEKAVLCLQAAEEIDHYHADTKLYLAQAFFGLGDFKSSLQYYGSYLTYVPSDAQARELRIEAIQSHLKTLDATKDASEVEIMETEVLRERAMIVALRADTERRDLKDLADRLMKATPQSPEEAKALADQVHRLAQNYIALGSVTYFDAEDTDLVRGELNALAGDAFQLLCAFSSASVYEDISKLTPLYEAYYHLSQGDMENAVGKLEPIRGAFPEAETILTKIEGDRLRSMNLAALEAWQAYIKDGEAVELDQAKSWQGELVNVLSEVFDNGRSAVSHVHDRWTTERKLLDRVKTLLTEGKCKTIKEGLEIISQEDDSDSYHHPSERAKKILDEMVYDDPSHRGTYALAHLIRYTSTLKPDPKVGEHLLDDADHLFAEYSAVETPYALATVVQHLTQDEIQKASAQRLLDTLVKEKSFGQSVWDMVRTMGTDDIAQIGIMHAASTVGALAKLATLNKLKDMGITGTKAILLAGGAEVLAEGTTLFALNTAYEATQHDTDVVFSTDHLLMGYGSSLVMVGGLKIFGAAGKQLAPRFARSLGLVESGGTVLSQGGKRLAWATGHAFGLGGMVATNQMNQLLGFAGTPPGGFAESLVHDVFGYAKYAIATKGFARVLGTKHAQASEARQAEIALRQAETLAEAKVNKMGYKTDSRTENGDPVFKNARGRRLYGEMVYLTLACPGFNAAKVEDPEYLKSLGLKARIKDGEIVGFKKISAHEAMGIKPAQAKTKAGSPSSTLIPADAALATGAVPLFASLVEGGVPVSVAAAIAGAALLLPMAFIQRTRGGEAPKAPEGYAPTPQPIGAPENAPVRSELARRNEYLQNLYGLDFNAVRGDPDFPGLQRRLADFQDFVNRANAAEALLKTMDPATDKRYELYDYSLKNLLAKTEGLMKEISADYRRLLERSRPAGGGTAVMRAPAEEPGGATQDTRQGVGFREEIPYDPYLDPENKTANPVEKLLYLQAVEAQEAKKAGRPLDLRVRVRHGDQLEPTEVTIELPAKPTARETAVVKDTLGLTASDVLQPGDYEISYQDPFRPSTAPRRLPVRVVQPPADFLDAVTPRAADLSWEQRGMDIADSFLRGLGIVVDAPAEPLAAANGETSSLAASDGPAPGFRRNDPRSPFPHWIARHALRSGREDLTWERSGKIKAQNVRREAFPERQTVATLTEAPDVGVAFFGADLYQAYYTGPQVLIGAPGGRPFFFMPAEDAGYIKSPLDAARYTGMSPSTEKAYKSNGDVLETGEVYGIIFPTGGMTVSEPTSVDANAWPHYLEGGTTAVRTDGPNGGYLVNPVREYVIPGGKTAPSGTKIFKLGPNGERIILREFN